MRTVGPKWINDAFRFMDAMNPDGCVQQDNGLGEERPFVEGPYFFDKKDHWRKHDFHTLLGDESENLWKTYKDNRVYQQVSGKDLDKKM